MLIYKQGDLLKDDAEVLVNAVNTVGVMEAGIAKQFKKQFPEMYEKYKRDCKANKLRLGKMHLVQVEDEPEAKYVINFPTLVHWQDQSNLSDIESGLIDLVRMVETYGFRTIAIPPLGCGVGGLNWEDVRYLIEQAFKSVDVRVHLYEPLS